MSTKTQTAERLAALERGQRITACMRACALWAVIEEHDKVLDLCCGEGALLNHLSQKCRLTVCGMCDTPDQARFASEWLGGADVIAARMEDIPWRDDTFDAVLLSAPLRGDAKKALEEVLRVLRPGGQFVMAAPLFRDFGDEELSRRAAMRLMEQIGFREVSFRTVGLAGAISGWKAGLADVPMKEE